MADSAWSPLNLCGTQLNRLDASGTLLDRTDGDTNVVLTCALVDITRNEIVGDDSTLRDANGSGGAAATRTRPGGVTGYEYEMTLCSRIDAELMELLGLVDRVIVSGATVGYKAKDIATASCDCDPTQSSQAGVSMMLWSLAWLGEAPHPDFSYVMEAVPKIIFKAGVARQKSAEFTTTTLTGVAQKNTNWGRGPANIYPETGGLNRLWAEWLTDTAWPGGCNCDVHGYRKSTDGVGVPDPIETV
jgi:hypothetical protein